jgi:RNA polymerase sigma factor (TIGR02999 family)
MLPSPFAVTLPNTALFMSDVTRILQSIEGGDPTASEELLPLVYDELRKLAASRLAHEASAQTLQPTALVHEAWLKLGGSDHDWNSRGHFFAAAAEAMRRILIDRARKRNRQRHGGGLQRINLDSVDVAITTDDETLLRLDEALTKLSAESPVQAQLVKLRYFSGLTIPQAACSLAISEATAKRHWTYARAWLYCELNAAG